MPGSFIAEDPGLSLELCGYCFVCRGLASGLAFSQVLQICFGDMQNVLSQPQPSLCRMHNESIKNTSSSSKQPGKHIASQQQQSPCVGLKCLHTQRLSGAFFLVGSSTSRGWGASGRLLGRTSLALPMKTGCLTRRSSQAEDGSQGCSSPTPCSVASSAVWQQRFAVCRYSSRAALCRVRCSGAAEKGTGRGRLRPSLLFPGRYTFLCVVHHIEVGRSGPGHDSYLPLWEQSWILEHFQPCSCCIKERATPSNDLD